VNAEERDSIRRPALDQPGWYSPWVHVAGPALFGLGAAALALSQLHEVKLWQLGFALGIFVLGNATAKGRIRLSDKALSVSSSERAVTYPRSYQPAGVRASVAAGRTSPPGAAGAPGAQG